jgi:hypothetical protein
MLKFTNVIIIASVFILTACGGRTPQPVMVSQYGDQGKSCDALRYDIQYTENEIQRLLPKTDKTGKNVALGVAGWFLIVPWFFMDFKNAEATEYQALRQRHQHLTSIAMSKKCKVSVQHYPSMEEMKREYEKQKAMEVKTKSTSNVNK